MRSDTSSERRAISPTIHRVVLVLAFAGLGANLDGLPLSRTDGRMEALAQGQQHCNFVAWA
eukprot:13111133-Alexandrium_andersonii.AAC.1